MFLNVRPFGVDCVTVFRLVGDFGDGIRTATRRRVS
jgi:hypothetical protein